MLLTSRRRLRWCATHLWEVHQVCCIPYKPPLLALRVAGQDFIDPRLGLDAEGLLLDSRMGGIDLLWVVLDISALQRQHLGIGRHVARAHATCDLTPSMHECTSLHLQHPYTREKMAPSFHCQLRMAPCRPITRGTP